MSCCMAFWGSIYSFAMQGPTGELTRREKVICREWRQVSSNNGLKTNFLLYRNFDILFNQRKCSRDKANVSTTSDRFSVATDLEKRRIFNTTQKNTFYIFMYFRHFKSFGDLLSASQENKVHPVWKTLLKQRICCLETDSVHYKCIPKKKKGWKK